MRVLPTHDARKVRASGPGLTSQVLASFPVEFNIDAKQAGQGQLSVLITVSISHTVEWNLFGRTQPIAIQKCTISENFNFRGSFVRRSPNTGTYFYAFKYSSDVLL